MAEPLKITSTKNPRIKHLLELQSKSKVRRKENRFIIEGQLEVKRAAESGYRIEEVYINESIIPLNEARNLLPEYTGDFILLSQDVFDKIAYRKTTGGILAIAIPKTHDLIDLKISSNPLLLVVESVEKPGNIGALLRTVDAAGIDGMIICDPQTDLYNPNVIRSSIGGVFTTSIANSSSSEVIEWLKENNIQILSTALTATARYDKINYSKPSAIVMGTESTGLSDIWLNNSDDNIIIPMNGIMDSLNVSVSAAVVVFEAARQRDFKASRQL
ncbi:MAG: TrmH family RNA methyltransferase [Candidatus Cyclobacteriaceae bacterium M2_1C_046]